VSVGFGMAKKQKALAKAYAYLKPWIKLNYYKKLTLYFLK
jgi:hypothetical protein